MQRPALRLPPPSTPPTAACLLAEGVLIIIVSEMISDLVTFIVLFILVTVAFSLGFMGLQSAGSYTLLEASESNRTNPAFAVDGAVWAPMWAVFGFFEPAQYDALASSMLYVYMFISSRRISIHDIFS